MLLSRDEERSPDRASLLVQDELIPQTTVAAAHAPPRPHPARHFLPHADRVSSATASPPPAPPPHALPSHADEHRTSPSSRRWCTAVPDGAWSPSSALHRPPLAARGARAPPSLDLLWRRTSAACGGSARRRRVEAATRDISLEQAAAHGGAQRLVELVLRPTSTSFGGAWSPCSALSRPPLAAHSGGVWRQRTAAARGGGSARVRLPSRRRRCRRPSPNLLGPDCFFCFV
jgi:hypothetical protein